MGYETDKAKKRRLQLHGPDEDVDFDFTGKLNFVRQTGAGSQLTAGVDHPVSRVGGSLESQYIMLRR